MSRAEVSRSDRLGLLEKTDYLLVVMSVPSSDNALYEPSTGTLYSGQVKFNDMVLPV